MSIKKKGSAAERDLVHKFWGSRWACIRAAGSGSSSFPCPDVLVGNGHRRLAIEVKVSGASRKYFEGKEVEMLKYFGEKFGAEPWVAVKFLREDWYFLPVEDLISSGKNFVFSLDHAKRSGLTFEEMTSL